MSAWVETIFRSLKLWTTLGVLAWSAGAQGTCDFSLLRAEEINQRLLEIGIRVENGLITQASRATPVGRTLDSLMTKYGIHISTEPWNRSAGGAYIPERKVMELSPRTLQVMVETGGQGISESLLHESHHVATFAGPSPEHHVRATWLRIVGGTSEAFDRYWVLRDQYSHGFAFDEIAAYRKDVIRRRLHLQEQEDPDLEGLDLREEILESFSRMTLDVAALIEEFLERGQNPSINTYRGKTTFSFSKPTGPLKWDRYELILPENHSFDLARPKDVLRYYVRELKRLADQGLSVAGQGDFK